MKVNSGARRFDSVTSHFNFINIQTLSIFITQGSSLAPWQWNWCALLLVAISPCSYVVLCIEKRILQSKLTATTGSLFIKNNMYIWYYGNIILICIVMLQEVCSQIYATLYDYPCLKTCPGLVNYTKDCVRLAWCLTNQNPPFVIDYETRSFRREMHMRFHSSNVGSDAIKSYLWPTLLEGENGPCVHRGVVLT